MATTATTIEETQANGVGSIAGAESSGNAAGAYPTDEQILGIGEGEDSAAAAPQTAGVEGARESSDAQTEATSDTASPARGKNSGSTEVREKTEGTEARAIPKEFETIFATAGAGAKLREIYQRESEYRELFPSVSEAQDAAQARQELARVDELFESGDPAAHVELMAGLAQRDPAAFRSLAATFGERLAEIDPEAYRVIAGEFARAALDAGRLPEQIELLSRAAEKGDAGAVKFLVEQVVARFEALAKGDAGLPPGRLDTRRAQQITERAASSSLMGARSSVAGGVAAGRFVESVNADVERSVEHAVGGRVAELLPDAPDGTRQKIAADIYRELDAALKKDSGLLQQVSANFGAAQKAGQFGENQRSAMAALVLSKAKAALPAVAKRVVGDWTAAVMGASQARRAKQNAVASRADVGVGGAPRPVSTQPARIDYGKMSDEEILNAE